jgi:hypothetical protein
MFTLTTPVTGAAQTGFTSPTYTISPDNNPGNNGKQWIVTALGGTQAGVTSHSASDPFTISAFKPLSYKVAQFISTTVFKRPPRNIYSVIVRKGVNVNSNFPKDVAIFRGTFEIPAGSEALDAANIRAALSLMLGSLTQTSAGWGDSLIFNQL